MDIRGAIRRNKRAVYYEGGCVMGCVYKAMNIVNGKWYIGKTVRNLKYRSKAHLYYADTGGGYAFHNALRKYGSENFKWEVLFASEDNSKLLEVEAEFIKQFRTLSPNGYNLTEGGRGSVGYHHTAEAIEKIQKASTGRKHSPESIIKMREIHTGKTITDETRNKLSNAFKGRKLSTESIAKMIAARTGTHHTAEAKGKMHIAQLGNKKNLGKKSSDEKKKKISIANTGKKRSLEISIKLSLLRRGKKRKPTSEETKNKISAANSGKKKPIGALAKAWATRRLMLKEKNDDKLRLVA